MFRLSQKSHDKLKGVNPELVRLANEAIKTSPYDFGISYGLRTVAEQTALYAQGRKTPKEVHELRKKAFMPVISDIEAGRIVTHTMKSRHFIQKDGFGGAFDFMVFVNGKLTWEEKYYESVGQHIENVAKRMGIKVTWGKNLPGFVDLPHIQVEI